MGRMRRSMASSLLALLLSCVAALGAATEIKTITVEGMVSSQQVSLRGNKFTVHLNGGQYQAFVRSDNTFAVPDVPVAAAYLVEVMSQSYVFDKVRLSILKNGNVRATNAAPTAPKRNEALPYPLRMQPRGAMQHFEVREGFNFGMIFKNPMMLMMGFSMLMMFMMKYMVDPEQMKEMQEQMADQGIESQGDMLKAMMGGGTDKAEKKKKGN